jgi:hypothetical protein
LSFDGAAQLYRARKFDLSCSVTAVAILRLNGEDILQLAVAGPDQRAPIGRIDQFGNDPHSVALAYAASGKSPRLFVADGPAAAGLALNRNGRAAADDLRPESWRAPYRLPTGHRKIVITASALVLTSGSTADFAADGNTGADRAGAAIVAGFGAKLNTQARGDQASAIVIPTNFRPVRNVMDSLGATSSVRLIPSGVSSKAHARTSALGNPSKTITISVCATHSGA